MIEKSIEEIVTLAEELSNSNKNWHFHMLTPDCAFNDRDDVHTFILEDTSDNQTYCHYSQDRKMTEGKKLVELLHQMEVNSEQSGSSCASSVLMEILACATDLNSRRISWHHHMFFPKCIFNRQEGSWNIVLEDKEKNRVLEARYQDEPVSDLKLLEKLFYAQKS